MSLTWNTGTKKLSIEKLALTSTATPSVGEVGEVIAATINTDTGANTSNTEVDVTGGTITLTPGQWLLCYGGVVRNESTANSGSPQTVSARLRVTDLTNNPIPNTASFTQYRTEANQAVNQIRRYVSFSIPLMVAVTTTYKLRLTGTSSSGTYAVEFNGADLGNFTGQDNDTYFYGVRLR